MSELENKPLEELKPEEQLQEVRLETSDESLAEEIVNQNEVEPVQLIEPEDVGISETENEIISETLTPEPVATETEIPEAIIEALPEVTSNVERDEHDESEVDSHEDSDDEFVSLTDYSTFSRQEIVDVLKQKLESSLIQKLKPEIDNLKLHFYRKIKLEVEAARKRFVEDGGKIEEFKAEPDEIEIAFKEHLNIYKNHRDQFRLKSENEKVDNLSRKLAIIEEIKNLPNDHDSINKTFNTFREIQRHWREVGPVPQAELNNLYETYNYHVEKFYDWLKINKELRDLDLKHNLDEKILICEKAEELFLEPSVVKAFRTLQKLHEHWREVGPVPLEKKEDVWNRFKLATAKINKSHQDHFENIREEQGRNLEAKTLICEKIEEYADSNFVNSKDWEEKTEEVLKLQQFWNTIGFVNKKDNSQIFERFRTATDNFFAAKRDFFAGNKEEQSNNLQRKIDLCLQAETLKDSTEWKKTTEDFIRMQKEWKEIGPVPRRHSEQIWKRFRTACDEFFKQKESHFSDLGNQFDTNLNLKREIISKLENFEMKENMEDNLHILKTLQKEWSEIGHVPFKLKDEIQKQFREAINKQFDLLKIDDSRRNLNFYRQKFETGTGKAPRHMQAERDKILDTIKQLEGDIALLSNNIGFFAKTKNAEAFIADVNLKIEKARQRIVVERQKLEILSKSEKTGNQE